MNITAYSEKLAQYGKKTITKAQLAVSNEIAALGYSAACAQSSYDQLKGRLLSAETETDQEMDNLQALSFGGRD